MKISTFVHGVQNGYNEIKILDKNAIYRDSMQLNEWVQTEMDRSDIKNWWNKIMLLSKCLNEESVWGDKWRDVIELQK
jgi:hypothetical protein